MLKKLIVITMFISVFVNSKIEGAPAQFIAKMYTEVLGRAPDADGWKTYLDMYKGSITLDQIKDIVIKKFYLSEEYSNREFTDDEKVITLYRGILARDPDNEGFNYYKSIVRDKGIEVAATLMLNSTEFHDVVLPGICTTTSDYNFRNGHLVAFGYNDQVVNVDDYEFTYKGTSSDELQAIIDNASETALNSGKPQHVGLLQHSLIIASNTIVIKKNVILCTVYTEGTCNYPRFAKIRRGNFDYINIIELEDNAKLENVWIDGARSSLIDKETLKNHRHDYNIRVNGNSAEVNKCRIDNTLGGSSIFINNTAMFSKIEDNLITSYTSEHLANRFSDGITCNSPLCTIKNNGIVDATDIFIVLFSGYNSEDLHPQSSIVESNTLVCAGKSAFSFLTLDPNTGLTSNSTIYSFEGSTLKKNILLGSNSSSHIEIMISVGTRAWFSNTNKIKGSFFITDNNSLTPSKMPISTNCNIGILVSDIIPNPDAPLEHCVIKNNKIFPLLTAITNLPLGYLVKVKTTISDPDADIQWFENERVLMGEVTDKF